MQKFLVTLLFGIIGIQYVTGGAVEVAPSPEPIHVTKGQIKGTLKISVLALKNSKFTNEFVKELRKKAPAEINTPQNKNKFTAELKIELLYEIKRIYEKYENEIVTGVGGPKKATVQKAQGVLQKTDEKVTGASGPKKSRIQKTKIALKKTKDKVIKKKPVANVNDEKTRLKILHALTLLLPNWNISDEILNNVFNLINEKDKKGQLLAESDVKKKLKSILLKELINDQKSFKDEKFDLILFNYKLEEPKPQN